jgi:preprotein translocase subunit SecF
MNIIDKKGILLGIAGVLVGLSILSIFVFGFEEGIDFKGGTVWQVKVTEDSTTPEILETTVKEQLPSVGDIRVALETTSDSFLVRLPVLSEEDHQKLVSAFSTKFSGFNELSFQSIGPSVGAELRKKSMVSIVLVLLGISLYIAYAFRKVSRPISSWKYGVVTLFSLLHDIAIPAGLMALLGHYSGVEIDSNFIVALLVVMGFSVHDTIVVFDRIRENLYLDKGKSDFKEVINQSIKQTIARSINTSLTLVIVLIALYLVGPSTLHYFILTLLVGVVMGTYSSIFVASPILYIWQNLKKSK